MALFKRLKAIQFFFDLFEVMGLLSFYEQINGKAVLGKMINDFGELPFFSTKTEITGSEKQSQLAVGGESLQLTLPCKSARMD